MGRCENPVPVEKMMLIMVGIDYIGQPGMYKTGGVFSTGRPDQHRDRNNISVLVWEAVYVLQKAATLGPE